MGKALIFNGITVTNPIQTVTFSDGLSPVVRSYISKLSTPVTDVQKEAFQTFYETLVNAGIWDKITLLYPMFGSVSDCAFGMKGDNIIIPTGTTYDKGINLTNASGGFGAEGKGIKIIDFFPTTAKTNYSLFVNYPYGWTSSQRGYVYVYASDATRETGGDGRYFGQSYSSSNGWMNIRGSLVNELSAAVSAGTNGFFGETHAFGNNLAHYLYHNGVVISSLLDGYDSTTNIGKLGINASPHAGIDTHLMNVPINMIIVSNGYALSASDVTTLSTAVATLSAIIF